MNEPSITVWPWPPTDKHQKAGPIPFLEQPSAGPTTSATSEESLKCKFSGNSDSEGLSWG